MQIAVRNIPLQADPQEPAPILRLWTDLLPPDQADALMHRLCDDLPWEQPSLRLFGHWHRIPRLQSWHGDAQAHYRYSGRTHAPRPWTTELQQLRALAERLTGQAYNSVLVNLYRDGQDRMGWHADDEPELGPAPAIASLSLGTERDFLLRQRGRSRTAFTLPLPHNSLLLMPPGMQAGWQHSLPARARVALPRLNLTFRRVVTTVAP